MSRYSRFIFTVLLLTGQAAVFGDEPVFSGPQVGEKLPPITVKGVFGDLADKDVELAGKPAEKPVLLIFFQKKTRPAFGLTNTIMKYAASRKRSGLQSSVIHLTDDVTDTRVWLGNVKQHLNMNVTHAISTGGPEGPGSYGLNRNVTLTVLVAKDGKVTANFALVQPSLQSDGPGILKAIADVTGGGKVPTIAELGGGRYGAQPDMKEALRPLLRAVIDKQASEADVEKAAATVERFVAKNRAARSELARISNTIVNSDKLSNYGTKAAQETLKRWAKKYGAAPKGADRSPQQDRKPRTKE